MRRVVFFGMYPERAIWVLNGKDNLCSSIALELVVWLFILIRQSWKSVRGSYFVRL